MDLSSESTDVMPAYPKHSHPLPSSSEQDHSLLQGRVDRDEQVSNPSYPQSFSLKEAPIPPTRGIVIRSHRFRTQKWFIVLTILLIIGVVLAIPFFSWKLFFSSAQSPAVHSHSTSAHASAEGAFMPSPTPSPIGTTILPTAGKIMTGISMAGDLNAISTFEKSIGKNVSILLLDQDWGATGGDQNFPTSRVDSIRAHGSLPMITWQPWVTKAYPQGNSEPAYALKNIIAGNFDSYIKQWAQDAKAWKNPIFLRFALEMNGNWTPWSEQLNGNKGGEFVRAWRHVHDIFTAVGAKNVTWVWNPNVNYNGSILLTEVYPGDAYVDWMAIDGFNWGKHTKDNTWFTFSQVYGTTYNAMLNISKKPIILAQTGSTEKGGNKAVWITNAYTVALPSQFPAVKAIVWFNEITQEDWRVNSSAAALSAFSQVMRSPIYAGNMYGNYLGG